ncbi:DUF805 domain-containing protein [Ligilactobacillus aviarius]|uniref:DUF805 domain-containing protein n=1 Tax=Ligilactobacillus aviarius TaxID=1606 RepID=UPI0024B99DBB|nr:DUF805 domain-containing protein [Ligilactobacillus aviarius]
MVFGSVLVLIVAVIFMLWMAHSSHFGLTGKIIAIIALPFVGAIIGFLGDLAVASQSVEWFPVLWMYGGFIGMIASLVVMIITATKASHENGDEPVVVFNSDGTEGKLKVTFIQGWKSFFRNAFNFNGRANLQMFGWGLLSYVIINFIWCLVMGVISGCLPNVSWLLMIISGLVLLGLTLPLLALNVRRLRDTGMKNGLNYTLNIIGFISPMFLIIGTIYKIVLLVLLCMPTGKFQKE